MADNVAITPGSGALVAADELTDAALGGSAVKVQYVKLMDGTIDGTAKALIDGSGLRVRIDPTQIANAGQQVAGSSVSVIPASNPLTASANGLISSRVLVTTAASPMAVNLKGSSGNLARMDLFNVAAYDVFFKFYAKATAPTVGTDTPVWTIPLKAGTGFSTTFSVGKSFIGGFGYGITKLQADTDTTALAIGDVTGSIDWI